MLTVTTGSDFSAVITLRKGGQTFDMSGDSAHAALVTPNASAVLIAATAQSSGATGADWSASKIVVEFSSTATAGITSYSGPATIQIQVNDGKKTSWHVKDVVVVKGAI